MKDGVDTMRGNEARNERLYVRALDIIDGRRNGFGEPILWHLALRGYGPAMIFLATRLSGAGTRSEFGRPADRSSAASLCYRAWRAGGLLSARNLAMSHFNFGDMQGYRHWMRRAAQVGDADGVAECRRFETRLPHADARKVGRLRPDRRDGS
ncbi:MAG: hypothetical protein V4574_11505 [Pseudomonadota bacterium]